MGVNNQVRRSMRSARRSVPEMDRRIAESAVAKNAASLIRPQWNVASYVAFDGEMPTRALEVLIAKAGAQLWLPCINGETMVFRKAEGLREENEYGIPEPVNTPEIDERSLDLVFIPLTAFNADGFRLGMGAGYYDRCFAFRGKSVKSPMLAGIGYAFQKNESFTVQPHDVPLDVMITEREIIWFERLREPVTTKREL